MEKIKKISKKRLGINITFVLLLVLLACFGIYSNCKVESLNKKVDDLNKNVESSNGTMRVADEKNKKLNDENTNLKNVIKTLQVQVNNSQKEASLVNPSTTVNPLAKIVVSGVSNRIITRTGSGSPIDHRFLSVSLTITNQSSGNQTYSIGNFYAISEAGKVINPLNLADPQGDNSWVRSELVAGGHENVAFLFPSDDNLVALVFTDPASGAQLTAALPPAL